MGDNKLYINQSFPSPKRDHLTGGSSCRTAKRDHNKIGMPVLYIGWVCSSPHWRGHILKLNCVRAPYKCPSKKNFTIQVGTNARMHLIYNKVRKCSFLTGVAL